MKLAVIGDPIEHSLSPKIHTFVMEKLGVECKYSAVCVKQGELAAFIDRVHTENISGFNVTMPHKVDVIQYLDWIDEDAKHYNSVNTVKVDGGRLLGYNTDGAGFLRSLEDADVTVSDKEILFLGAGGVVNTLSKKLTLSKAQKVVILNKSPASAASICEKLKENFEIDCEFDNLDFDTISEKIRTADIVINATPLGMSGFSSDWKSCEFLKSAKSDVLIADLIYNPRETKLLNAAKELGLKTLNGMGMLIYQALGSDEIYLGRKIENSDEIARGLELIV